jgi:hypothetical protein
MPSRTGPKAPEKVLAAHERKNKKKYLVPCLDQRRHFSPFVVSTDRHLGKESKHFADENFRLAYREVGDTLLQSMWVFPSSETPIISVNEQRPPAGSRRVLQGPAGSRRVPQGGQSRTTCRPVPSLVDAAVMPVITGSSARSVWERSDLTS